MNKKIKLVHLLPLSSVSILIILFSFFIFTLWLWQIQVQNCLNAGHRGNFSEAINTAQNSIYIAQIYGNNNNPLLLSSLGMLGEIYESRRDFSQAYLCYEKQLKFSNCFKNPMKESSAEALVNVGRILKKQRKFAEAKPYLEQALYIYQTINPSSQKTADTLDFLAWTAGNLGEYEKSIALYTRELTITEKLYGKENILNITSLVGMGWVLNQEDNYKKALLFFNEAYALVKNQYGSGTAWSTVSLTTLAGIYRDHKDYEKSEYCYKAALEMADQTLYMRSNLFKADIMEGYAKLLRGENDNEKAAKLDNLAKQVRNGTY